METQAYKFTIPSGIIIILASLTFILFYSYSGKILKKSLTPDAMNGNVNIKATNENTNSAPAENSAQYAEEDYTFKNLENWFDGGIKMNESSNSATASFDTTVDNENLNLQQEIAKIAQENDNAISVFEYDKSMPENYDQFVQKSYQDSVIKPDLDKINEDMNLTKNISFKLFSDNDVKASASMGAQLDSFNNLNNPVEKSYSVALLRYISLAF